MQNLEIIRTETESITAFPNKYWFFIRTFLEEQGIDCYGKSVDDLKDDDPHLATWCGEEYLGSTVYVAAKADPKSLRDYIEYRVEKELKERGKR